ncbi:MAG: CBS domain-containing protein [Nitrososphaeria archaeon]|nr:CBS domain-containing protein [Nitrososphaeria archaeon]
MPTVEDFMTNEVFVVKPSDTLARAKNLMLSKKIGRLVVVEDDKVVGILTREDIAKAIISSKPSIKSRPIDQLLVSHFMRKEILTVQRTASISEAAKLMLDKEIGGVPVTSGKRLIGIITTHDITKYVAQLPLENLLVKDYMCREVATVSPFHSIAHVAELLFRTPTHRVIVLDARKKPVGIITPSNLTFVKFATTKAVSSKRSLSRGGEATHERISYVAIATAEDIMTTPLVIVHENDNVKFAASIMVKKDIGALPVLNEGGSVSGIFSKKEVLEIASKRG